RAHIDVKALLLVVGARAPDARVLLEEERPKAIEREERRGGRAAEPASDHDRVVARHAASCRAGLPGARRVTGGRPSTTGRPRGRTSKTLAFTACFDTLAPLWSRV